MKLESLKEAVSTYLKQQTTLPAFHKNAPHNFETYPYIVWDFFSKKIDRAFDTAGTKFFTMVMDIYVVGRREDGATVLQDVVDDIADKTDEFHIDNVDGATGIKGQQLSISGIMYLNNKLSFAQILILLDGTEHTN